MMSSNVSSMRHSSPWRAKCSLMLVAILLIQVCTAVENAASSTSRQSLKDKLIAKLKKEDPPTMHNNQAFEAHDFHDAMSRIGPGERDIIHKGVQRTRDNAKLEGYVREAARYYASLKGFNRVSVGQGRDRWRFARLHFNVEALVEAATPYARDLVREQVDGRYLDGNAYKEFTKRHWKENIDLWHQPYDSAAWDMRTIEAMETARMAAHMWYRAGGKRKHDWLDDRFFNTFDKHVLKPSSQQSKIPQTHQKVFAEMEKAKKKNKAYHKNQQEEFHIKISARAKGLLRPYVDDPEVHNLIQAPEGNWRYGRFSDDNEYTPPFNPPPTHQT